MKRVSILVLCIALVMSLASCVATTPEDTHVHTYSAEWSKDATNHWHAASCEHTDEKTDSAAHVDANNDKLCDICGYDYDHTHTYATAWSMDAENHWHAANCGCTIAVQDSAKHADSDNDGLCNACGLALTQTVTVFAPDNVTVDGELTVAKGADVTFTLTTTYQYELTVNGAEQVGEVAVNGANYVYTYKVANVNQNKVVVVTSDKTAFVNVIADDVLTLTNLQANKFTTGSFKVTLPTAGEYTIKGSGFSNYFSINEDMADATSEYTFTADEAGEITVYAKYFSMDALESYEMAYMVAQYEPLLTLDSTEGEGVVLPTNYQMPVKIDIEKPGIYKLITTVEGISINDELKNTYLFGADSVDTIYLTVKLDDEADGTFEFDWVLEEVTATELTAGTAEQTFANNDYAYYTFTASQDGIYRFAVDSTSAFICEWNGGYMNNTYSNEYTLEMFANDTFSFFVYYNNYEEDAPATAKANLTAEFYGVSTYVDTYWGVLEGKADSNGLANVIVVPAYAADATYIITAEAPFTVGVEDENGNVTYGTTAMISIAAGSAGRVFIKTSETVTEAVSTSLNYEEFSTNVNLVDGDNELTLLAGYEYSFNLNYANFGFGEDIIISWDHTDFALMNGDVAYENGSTTQYSFYLNFTATVTENTTVTISVVSASAPAADLVLGENSVYVTVDNYYCAGTDVTFTATEAGTYTLTLADGEQNADICNVSNGYELIETYPYTFTLDAGESITFIVCTSANMTLTEDYIDFVISAEGGSSAGGNSNALVLGNNAVTVTVVGYYCEGTEVTFTATEAGTYTISAAEGEENADIGIPDMYGIEWIDLPYTVELAEGESITITVCTSAYMTVTEDTIDLVITKA